MHTKNPLKIRNTHKRKIEGQIFIKKDIIEKKKRNETEKEKEKEKI